MQPAGAVMARAVAFLGVTLLLGSAEAGTFRFEDEAGVVHYTNVSDDPRYHLLGPPPPEPPAEPRHAAPIPWSVRFAEPIRAAAERHSVDPRLVEAVIAVESAGNPGAVSRKGAQGLMQLMPQRSAELGVQNPFDPRENVDGGVRHLRDLLQRFTGNVTLALAAYNAGEAAVRTYQGVPPFPETQDYVRKVRARYQGAGLAGEAPTPQRIYREVAEDGTLVFTNVPPSPSPTLQRRF